LIRERRPASAVAGGRRPEIGDDGRLEPGFLLGGVTDRAFPAIRFNAVDPGYTATDLNGLQGTRTVEEGAEIIVRMASIGADGPTGEALAV
jgi:hypothetical protein